MLNKVPESSYGLGLDMEENYFFNHELIGKMEIAFNRGVDDKKDGKNLSNNPYFRDKDKPLRQSWVDGFSSV